LNRRATSATPSNQTVSPLARGRGRDGQRLPIPAGQFCGGPWREAFGVTESFGAGNRRQDAAGPGQEIPSRMIEIVGVLVVTEQHGIDFADRVGAERRTG
jgi:hypothetical protein